MVGAVRDSLRTPISPFVRALVTCVGVAILGAMAIAQEWGQVADFLVIVGLAAIVMRFAWRPIATRSK